MIRSKIASRPPAQAGFWRAKIMTFLWALLTLALHLSPGIVSPAHAQGSRKDDIVFNTRGIPLAGATIRVCTMPASGQPCTPLAQIYSDSGLTQALANPTTTDGLGNYFFYAAPGQYEIEVSGPGITTKQLPNVILPNDPSAPTFASVTTSAINAFSLSLSGNLTVNGNTTVVGNLASGTLNLSNQSTPPGAAGSGTVNLYTKTTDKRLYYKDDTGTEIGPLASGSGAQTNVPNTFTAQQNFDANFESKGPNPYFSLARYGGYGSSTNPAPTITCSINSGSTTLTCPSGSGDFLNGHGVVIPKAGAATTVTTPGQPTVTPTNLLNGSTTYTYQVIAEDRQGGLTASSTSGQTTSGAATLGANNITFSSCVRTNGVATYTSSVAHNLQAGAQVAISGFTGGVFDSCNGVKTIASTTSTTFTTNDGQLANETNTTGSPVVTVMACNTLTFTPGSASFGIRYWIYRNGALAGVAVGIDPWFQDCGSNVNNVPSYVPSAPPSSAQPGYLASTIVSGAGSNSLTLANSAATSVSNAVVLHDNSLNLKAAIQAAYNNGGGAVYISNGLVYVPFNATLDLTTGLSNTFGYSVKIHDNDDFVLINQPWILRSAIDIEGEPHQSTSFSYVNGSQVFGAANPMFLISEGQSGVHFNRLFLNLGGIQQTAILTDSGTDGGGVTGLVLDDVNVSGNNGLSRPLVFKGGFDYFLNRGTCFDGATSFKGSACLQFTNSSLAVTFSSSSQISYQVRLNGMYFSGGAIDFDCAPNSLPVATSALTFQTSLYESAVAPYLRFNCPTGVFNGIALQEVEEADSIVGFGTAVVDAQNGGNSISLLWTGGYVGNANQPLYISPNSLANALVLDGPFNNLGNVPYTSLSGFGLSSTSPISAAGSGRLVYSLPTPLAPGVVLSSGGSVPIQALAYQIQWVDVDGNFSAVSPSVTVTPTSGNQTVTLTPPAAPVGAVGYVPYRNTVKANVQAFGTCNSILPITQVFVDTYSFACGNALNTGGTGGGSGIVGPNGLSGQQLRLTSNGNVASMTFPNALTANRTFSIPDVTGYLPVTSYLNSAYDNATRANGAIGANWTLTNNGINISSNNFVGTTGGTNNVAFWSANSFSSSQFAQVTLTTVTGTDFPGVAVLLSGSGAATQGYNCIETTTNIYLQKISGTTNTTLTSAASTGVAGDILRLEAAPGGALTCYKNSVSTLTATDATYTSGQPGLFLNGTTGASKNWSGGNLHPITHLDVEQDWNKTQHFTQGMALSGETLTASPRGEQNVFLPGALTSTWTGSTWTPDKAVTVTRLQVQAKTAPSGCTTSAVVRLTDGTTPVNLTIAAASNDSGSIAQNYAAGAALTIAVQTAAAGCTTSPADANVVVQYRMQ